MRHAMSDAQIDWDAIRAEYIGGGTTYRRLAQKYGVGVTTIAVRAGNEGWTRDRQVARDESRDLAIRKASSQAAENAEKLEYARSLMIDRVIKALEHMPEGLGNRVRQTGTDPNTGRQTTVDFDILKLVSALEKLSNVSASGLSRQLDLAKAHTTDEAYDKLIYGNDDADEDE